MNTTSPFFNFSTQFDMVLDCDDVCVNITPKWMYLLLQNDKFRKLLTHDHLSHILLNHPFNRKEYDLISHAPYTLDEDLRSELNKIALEIYYNDSTFYDDLTATGYFDLALSLLRNSHAKRISIVSQSKELSLPVNLSKIRFLQNIFKEFDSSQYNIFLLNSGEKKSDVIKNEIPNYTNFVDDHLSNIFDVVENTNSFNKEFLAPLTGFSYSSDNKTTIERLTREKQCSILFYNIDLKLDETSQRLYEPNILLRSVLIDNEVLSLQWHK
jgi:hypothetical protein